MLHQKITYFVKNTAFYVWILIVSSPLSEQHFFFYLILEIIILGV